MVTPLTSYSNVQESSTTDGANTDVSIPGSQLESGKKYLILYAAGYGGGGTSNEVGVRVEHGATVIARSSDEGSSSGSPEACRIHNLSGFYILTGDGASDLRIKFTVFSGTCYVKGKVLIAIPLDELTENQDYWFAQQNGDAAEASGTTWVDVLTLTKTLPETTAYLVLASMEAFMTGGSSSAGEAMRFQIGGVAQKREWGKEWETNNDSRNFAYARIHNLNAGENTFKLQGGVSQGTVTAYFRRGRIIVIKANVFDQLVSVINDVQEATPQTYEISGAEEGWDNYLTKTYTPNQTEYVIVIGNAFAWQGQNYRSVCSRIENTTDAKVFSEFSSDDAKDINVDRVTHLVLAAEQISVAKTYAFQLSNENNTGTDSQRQYGDIIVWSMTLAIGVVEKDFSDAGSGADVFVNPFRAMGFDEVGGGVEVFGIPFKAMGFGDSGLGSDVFEIPYREMGFADVGGGADAFTLFLEKAFSDAGHGADVFSKIITLLSKAFSDAGLGTDVFETPFRSVKFSDAGGGVDVFVTPFKSMGFADVGQGLDVFAVIYREVGFEDVGGGVDVFVIPFREVGFSDVGSGLDVFFLLQEKGFSDIGGGVDVFVIPFKAFKFDDVGSGIDAFAVLCELSFSDVGQGSDIFAVVRKLGFSDLGSGLDAFSVPFRLLGFADIGSGVEVFSIPFPGLFGELEIVHSQAEISVLSPLAESKILQSTGEVSVLSPLAKLEIKYPVGKMKIVKK